MTPEDALHMARFQRPGVKLIVGPTDAREEKVAPLSAAKVWHLPGDPSCGLRDIRLRLGFTPSLWAICFAAVAEFHGHSVTDEEWQWLHGPASHADARAWLAAIDNDLPSGP